MRISTNPSNQQLSLFANPTGPKKPLTERWSFESDYKDTASLVVGAPSELRNIYTKPNATYVFTDGTTTKGLTAAQRTGLKKQLNTVAIGHALFGLGAGLLVGGVALLHMSLSGGLGDFAVGSMVGHLLGTGIVGGVVATVAGLAASAPAILKALRAPEGTPVEKQVSGKISLGEHKNVLFQPNGRKEKINLTEFQHAEPASKADVDKQAFDQPWWNEPGLARPVNEWYSADGNLKG